MTTGGKKHQPPQTVLLRMSLGYQTLTCEDCKIITTDHRNKIIIVSNILIHNCSFTYKIFCLESMDMPVTAL